MEDLVAELCNEAEKSLTEEQIQTIGLLANRTILLCDQALINAERIGDNYVSKISLNNKCPCNG